MADFQKAFVALRRAENIVNSSQSIRSLNETLPPHGFPPPDPSRPRGAARELAKREDVIFDDVHFAYPSRPGLNVLKGFSLTLQRGSVTALVGLSGAGKSTVAGLLAQFHEPQSGSIRLGDTDIRCFRKHEWVDAVAYVPQDPSLVRGTIAQNMAFGLEEGRSMDEVQEAAKLANAHTFVQDFPDGYDTFVTEGGASLSGGQRQRVAIARALLKDSPILILDEATASLDAESEALVQSALRRLMSGGRTVLIIAHRLATVQECDYIAYLDMSGRIVEYGTHTELISKRGKYSELVDTQRLVFE